MARRLLPVAHGVLLSGALGAAVWTGGCRVQADEGKPTPSAAPVVSAPRATQARHLLLRRASDGDVAPVVQGALAEARREGRQLLVYEGAHWCEPCQKFHRAAEQGKLDAAFPTLTLLEFDADEDHERLATAGYVSRYIPLFAVPNADGTSTGRQVEGSVKGDAVADLTPRLQQLLAGP